MTSKKILMACLHYWNSPYQVASHHLARKFAGAGWKVAYISSPITPLHFFKGFQDNLLERLAIWKKGTMNDIRKNIWTYTPFSLIAPDNRPLLRNRFIIDKWNCFTYPTLLNVIKQNGFGRVDMLYLDNFYHAFWLDSIEFTTSVYHMADNYSAFPGYSHSFAAVEKRLVQKSDCVLFPSQSMESYVKSMHPKKCEFISNGVDVEHFSAVRHKLPFEYRNISSPIAVYVGAIEKWFDFELLKKTATALNTISFVLIGSKARATKKLSGLPNVYLLGSRNWQHLPAYLQHADVGIIPFNTKAYPDLINPVRPLKLFEYFASGLPVVSMKWNELRNINSPAVLCETGDRFIEQLAEIVKIKHNKDEFQNYASKYDWGKIFLTYPV